MFVLPAYLVIEQLEIIFGISVVKGFIDVMYQLIYIMIEVHQQKKICYAPVLYLGIILCWVFQLLVLCINLYIMTAHKQKNETCLSYLDNKLY